MDRAAATSGVMIMKKIIGVIKVLFLILATMACLAIAAAYLNAMSSLESDPYYLVMLNLSSGTALFMSIIIALVMLEILLKPLLEKKYVTYIITILIFVFIYISIIQMWEILGLPFGNYEESEKVLKLQIEYLGVMIKEISILFSYLAIIVFLTFNYISIKGLNINKEKNKQADYNGSEGPHAS